jgi:Tol biopolymer transport system component
VYTINPDGTGRRQLSHVSTAHAAGAPDWPADSTKIVYESNQSGDYRIWVMTADGSGQRRLTGDPGFADMEPARSPDGKHILFSRGTGLHRVTRPPLQAFWPGWSPVRTPGQPACLTSASTILPRCTVSVPM